jgi:hypothetical protein
MPEGPRNAGSKPQCAPSSERARPAESMDGAEHSVSIEAVMAGPHRTPEWAPGSGR